MYMSVDEDIKACSRVYGECIHSSFYDSLGELVGIGIGRMRALTFDISSIGLTKAPCTIAIPVSFET